MNVNLGIANIKIRNVFVSFALRDIRISDTDKIQPGLFVRGSLEFLGLRSDVNLQIDADGVDYSASMNFDGVRRLGAWIGC